MFPYPSGRIHIGHVRNYTLGDVLARYMRARGKTVLHPMGWDAFGLPAENAAIQRGVHPGAWTSQNIQAMKAQLKSMGLSLDWTREFATCDPAYYRHQQKLFLDFLKAGLVTRKKSKVNWDPVDMTVLANEQVIDGRGWRSGAVVEQRELTQWFFKVSDFSEELLSALDGLDGWPDKVRLMQRNWIGKSEGLRLLFEVVRSDKSTATSIEVFTTRPDTIFGAAFIALSPDHPLSTELAAKDAALKEFIDECHRRGTATETLEKGEKLGYATGLWVKHPVARGPDPARLCRELRAHGLRHRRHLRLGRRTTSATSTSPASTACPCCPSSCPRAPIPHPSSSAMRPIWGPAGLPIPGSSMASRSKTARPGSPSISPRASSTASRRASSKPTIACATGASRASATGAARSR